MRNVVITIHAKVNDLLTEEITSPEMMDLLRNWIWHEKKSNPDIEGIVTTATVEFDR